MKPRDFIHVLENAEAAPLSGHDEGGEALLVLLAHMYFADDRIDPGEAAQFRRLAGVDDAEGKLAALRDKPLDIPGLAALFPDPADRDDILTLAEHAVWGDEHPDFAEWDIVDKLVEGLGVVRD